jgi:hypothetical protein
VHHRPRLGGEECEKNDQGQGAVPVHLRPHGSGKIRPMLRPRRGEYGNGVDLRPRPGRNGGLARRRARTVPAL